MSDLCVVCRHRHPTWGYVCDIDRDKMWGQLNELPRRLRAVTLQLVPGGTSGGERVATSRTDAPIGARLEALTLVGPGSDGLSYRSYVGMFHPHVRKWRTVTEVTVQRDTPDGPVDVPTKVGTWHLEPALDDDGYEALVAYDDQVGILPPAEWLDSWARTWRKHFAHRERPPVGRRVPTTRAPEGPAGRQHAINVVLGMSPGHGGAPVLRTDDPLAEEWELRFGETAAEPGVRADVEYLCTWLHEAADENVAIADFAAELRTVTAELARVLGEQPSQQWLGRCPAVITERDTDRTHPCGAGLWQDPNAPQVICHRCRSEWGPGKTALLYLARSIRRTWPIDRRRRYTLDEIEAYAQRRPLRCPDCGFPVEIDWRDATGRGEGRRTWRPAAATCPAGCPAAGRLI